MRLAVRHRTTQHYDEPAEYAAQILRLTPRFHDGLEIVSWQVSPDARGRMHAFTDGFANLSHCLTVSCVHDSLDVLVEGIVLTSDTGGLVRGAVEPLAPSAYLRTTPLTAATTRLEALAVEAAEAASPDARCGRFDAGVTVATETTLTLFALMNLVHDRLEYRSGATTIATTAGEALAGAAGVCQDYAHVFVACARILGIPARYVGGYLFLDSAEAGDDACHAWAEAYDRERGWLGFDPTNKVVPGERHVRTSIGLDYDTASPVRGIRRGLGGERLHLAAQVARISER